MKKNKMFSILSFALSFCSLIAALNMGVSAGTREEAVPDGGGGYPHAFYGGTFALNGIGDGTYDPVMGVKHYAWGLGVNDLRNNAISISASAYYPTFVSYPVIVDQVTNGNFAWVKIRATGKLTNVGMTFTAEHSFRASTSNQVR